MEGLLKGVRVLDLGHFIACPYCGLLIAAMGAEVIQVKRPGEGQEVFLPFEFDPWLYFSVFYGANKKGITLDLTHERGREIFRELVRKSDVVLDNFGVEAAKALGLEYEVLKEINPQIILVSITGFGQYGPYAHRLAFDGIAQAMSGAMMTTGFADGPPIRSGINFVDYGAALYAAIGTLSALYHREKTGKGQMVDVSLVDTAVSFRGGVFAFYQLFDWITPRLGNRSPFFIYDCFKARDGWVKLAVLSGRLWRRLARAMGKEELISDPRFADDAARCENIALLYSIVSEWIEEKTVDELIALTEKAQIPCGQVYDIPEVLADPHIRAREMIVDIDYPGLGKVPLAGFPIKFSETPGNFANRGPLLGEHNEEIYCGLLGFSRQKLAGLQEEGIV